MDHRKGSRPRAGLLMWVIPGLAVSLAVAGTPESADRCGSCHRDIYRMWRNSAHAQALEDPFFLDPFNRIQARHGTQATRGCLRCHAPLAGLIDDPGLLRAITREGVNCEFCHGLVAVEIVDGSPRHRVDIGEVKRGTIRGAESNGHDVAYSRLHRQSLVCAPCHEYTTASGTAVMTTYSEWEASQAAERGQTCQSCHMSLVESNVVDPRIKRDSAAQVNLHEMPGGHSLEQLHKALKVRLKPARTEQGLEVRARITNHGAGHAVPTGMPGRRIVLRLEVRTNDGQAFDEQRTYEKRFVDEQGARVDHVADLFFADGLRLSSDTRIAADELRDERFVFPVPASASAWISLRLEYEHAPWGDDEPSVSTVFVYERRFVRAEKP